VSAYSKLRLQRRQTPSREDARLQPRVCDWISGWTDHLLQPRQVQRKLLFCATRNTRHDLDRRVVLRALTGPLVEHCDLQNSDKATIRLDEAAAGGIAALPLLYGCPATAELKLTRFGGAPDALAGGFLQDQDPSGGGPGVCRIWPDACPGAWARTRAARQLARLDRRPRRKIVGSISQGSPRGGTERGVAELPQQRSAKPIPLHMRDQVAVPPVRRAFLHP
jgi:hypothetical protein